MAHRRPDLGSGIILAVGMALGAALAANEPQFFRATAGAGDHPDGTVVTTGSIGIDVDPTNNTTYTKEAVYYLNYSKGRLLAAIPHQIQTAASRQVLSDYAERDLVQDFGLRPGGSYHFEMTTGSLGGTNGGLAPLYVFETTTGQMAIYQIKQQYAAINATSSGMSATRPALELIERRRDPRLARAGQPLASAATR